MEPGGRNRRVSGRRRLRDLLHLAVESHETVEEVRELHPCVGGLAKALLEVTKLGMHVFLEGPKCRETKTWAVMDTGLGLGTEAGEGGGSVSGLDNSFIGRRWDG
ncbi:unnamed protein product, partial [Choristocarpus tenellus]